ncbi:MAG: hypothetical protein M1839_002414 [Geoglossum umbratile]|nr:MAG: hypothetical protein M1839_002414 [Geoglossum umbratile]
MATLHHDDMLSAMKHVLQSAKYSDLTIICGNREFNVHRSIVCPRSRFFAAACDGKFLEGKTGKIILAGDDVETVKRMISYLYTLDYEDEERYDAKPVGDLVDLPIADKVVGAKSATAKERPRSTEGCRPALFSSVRVYAIAEKYDIPALKTLAKERFSEWAKSNWSHKDFPILVREVFESTPTSDRGLRDVASQLFAKHVKLLLQGNGDLDVIEDLGDLWLGVLRQVLEDKEEEMAKVLSGKVDEMDRAVAEKEEEVDMIQICRLEEVEREKALNGALQAEVAKLNSMLEAIRGENKRLNVQLRTLESDLDEKNNELQRKAKKVNDLERCRHCRESFNARLEDFKYSGITEVDFRAWDLLPKILSDFMS